jgi:transcriptional regulator with XRE-family HTH domain
MAWTVQFPRMESHEVLKRALKKTSPKAVASELGISLSLVYKWAEKPSEDGSGSRNPLDRLQKVIDLSGDHSIVEWLCRQNGGHFVMDPEVEELDIQHVMPATQELIAQFSGLLSQISTAAVDHSITKDEAKEIREIWDKLKSYAEGFVRCCEKGDFEQMVNKRPSN